MEAQLNEKISNGTATEDEKKQHELLGQLKDGSIEAAGIEQLASMLGTDAKTLSLLKGFGNGGNMCEQKNSADIK